MKQGNFSSCQIAGHPVLKALIILGCLFRIWTTFSINPLDWRVSDGLRHWHNSENLFSTHLLPALDPIGYQIFIWLIRSTFGESYFLWAIVHSLLSVSFVYFWGKFAQSVLPSIKAALFATLLIAWTPSLLFSFSYLMSETLLLPLLGAALAYSMKIRVSPTIPKSIGVGLLWGLCAQVRIVALPFAAVALIAAFWPTKSFRKLLLALVVVCCCSLPQTYRSDRSLGFIAPFGGTQLFNHYYFWSGTRRIKINIDAHERGSFNYVFGSPSLEIAPLAPISNWTTIREGEYVLNIDTNHGKRDWIEGSQISTLDKREIGPVLIFEGLVYFLFGHSWPEASSDNVAGLLSFHSRWLWAPLMTILLVLSIGYLFFVRATVLPLLFVVSSLTIAFQTTCIMEGRYRKPLEPLAIICMVFFVHSIRRTKFRDSVGS